MPTITTKLIYDGRSANGGWSKSQLKILGIDWPPKQGWIEEVEGLQITLEKAAKFISLKDSHIKSAKKSNLPMVVSHGDLFQRNVCHESTRMR